MEFLIKKNIENKNSVNEIELSSLLGLNSFINTIKKLEDKIVSLEEEINLLKKNKITRKEIIKELTNNEVITFCEPLNISSSSSIEKLDLPNGLFYYDTVNGKFRGKIKGIWKTFNNL